MNTNLKSLPARLSPVQVAWLLGITLADVKTLTKNGLIVPLGKSRQSPKYFHLNEIKQKAKSKNWMTGADDCINKHWAKKNGKKTN